MRLVVDDDGAPLAVDGVEIIGEAGALAVVAVGQPEDRRQAAIGDGRARRHRGDRGGHLVKADLTERPFKLDFGGGKTVATRTLIIAAALRRAG